MRRDLLEIADELRSIAQIGLHFSEGPFDLERYERILALALRLGAVADQRSSEELRRLYKAADEGYVTPKLDVRSAVLPSTGLALGTCLVSVTVWSLAQKPYNSLHKLT